MKTIEDYKQEIARLNSEHSKMAGMMGGMTRYLDDAGIPPADKTHKRVKLLCVLYQQEKLENQRLRVLMDDF